MLKCDVKSLRSYVSRRCGCNRPGIYCCFESFCGGWRREGEGSLHAQQFDNGWILTKQLLRDGWQVRLEQEYWKREFLKMAQCEDDIWVWFPLVHYILFRGECIISAAANCRLAISVIVKSSLRFVSSSSVEAWAHYKVITVDGCLSSAQKPGSFQCWHLTAGEQWNNSILHDSHEGLLPTVSAKLHSPCGRKYLLFE